MYNIDAYLPKPDENGNLAVAPPLELTPEERAADLKRFSYGRIFGWWWRKSGRSMLEPHAPTVSSITVLRTVGRLFGGGKPDPMEIRLAQAGNAGTPLAPDEASALASARAEIRRGESTTDPLTQ